MYGIPLSRYHLAIIGLSCAVAIGSGFTSASAAGDAGAKNAKNGATLSDCVGPIAGVTVTPNAAAPGAKVTVTVPSGFGKANFTTTSTVAFVTLAGDKCKVITPVAGSAGGWQMPFGGTSQAVPVRADFCSYPEAGPWYVVVTSSDGDKGGAQFTPLCSHPIVVPSGGFTIPNLPGGPPKQN